jgi:hypothetical protein
MPTVDKNKNFICPPLINIVYERNFHGNFFRVYADNSRNRSGRVAFLAYGRGGTLGKNGAYAILHLRRLDGA